MGVALKSAESFLTKERQREHRDREERTCTPTGGGKPVMPGQGTRSIHQQLFGKHWREFAPELPEETNLVETSISDFCLPKL